MCHYVVEPDAVAGEVLHHGLSDQAPPGDPRAHLECHGGVPVPPGHPAVPAVLPPAQSAAPGGRYGGPLQPRPGPLPHSDPAGSHHRSLQVVDVLLLVSPSRIPAFWLVILMENFQASELKELVMDPHAVDHNWIRLVKAKS